MRARDEETSDENAPLSLNIAEGFSFDSLSKDENEDQFGLKAENGIAENIPTFLTIEDLSQARKNAL
jgi:hypothetical protein